MIQHVQGDATHPQGDGTKVIAHVVNDEGKWGRGFVLSISKRWKEPEEYYLLQHKNARWKRAEFELGLLQWVCVEIGDDGIFVVNMIAQHGLRSKDNPVPLKYDALEKCLTTLAEGVRGLQDHRKISVHMPKIGSGLAGGHWPKIELLVDEVMWDLPVFVYTKEVS